MFDAGLLVFNLLVLAGALLLPMVLPVDVGALLLFGVLVAYLVHRHAPPMIQERFLLSTLAMPVIGVMFRMPIRWWLAAWFGMLALWLYYALSRRLRAA